MMPSECGVTSRSRMSLFVVGERGALDRGAERDDLVGVHALARLEAEELGDRLLHARHARHAADEDHVLDLVLRDLGFLERARADLDGALDEIARSAPRASRASASSAGAAPRCGRVEMMNGRLISVSLTLDSSHFAFSATSLRRCSAMLVLAEIDAVLLLEAEHEPVDDAAVEVLAAEERVAGRRDDLEHAVRRSRGSRCRTCRRRGRRRRPCARCCGRSRTRAPPRSAR